MSENQWLQLTDVSLCAADSHAPHQPSHTGRWDGGSISSVEVYPHQAEALVLPASVGVMLRCPLEPGAVDGAVRQRVAGITLWVESSISVARRNGGDGRPPSALNMRRSIEMASDAHLESVVAFPLEAARSRGLLNLSYLAQSCGATRIRLVEGTGSMHPLDLFRSIRSLRERLSTPLEVDISNRFGLALGSALCAMRAGVHHFVVTVDPAQDAHIPAAAFIRCARVSAIEE